MSASGMRILMMIALCGLVSLASAQNRLLGDTELDKLKLWYPAYKPTIVSRTNIPERFRQTDYETIAQLIDSVARKETVQALRINAEVLKKGSVERLTELKDLHILHLELDTVTATAALWQVIGKLKHLQRLSIVSFGPVNRAFSNALTTSLSQLSQVEQLTLWIQLTDWEPAFSAMSGMPRLRKLHFSGNGYPTVIPPGVGKIRQLTSLTIRSNDNRLHFPASISELTKLKELNLMYLQLGQTTDWTFLSKLTELEILRMANTQLDSLPDLRSLKSLKILDLNRNEQLIIPAGNLEGLNALEEIDLSYCKLKDYPLALTGLAGLKKLILSYNPLGELPSQVGSLKQLESLQISGCQLRKLPETLGNLTEVRRLDMSQNQLDTLSFNFGKLTELTTLALNDNQLRYLPASIGQLKALIQLRASNNKLVQLPETIGDLENMTDLSLGMNQLTRLPVSIGKLVKLRQFEVTQNQLQQLPAGVGQLRKLKSLTLGGNKLTQLPETLGELDSLQWLDVSRNQLTSLPGGLFRLVHLQSLNLFDNKLTSLPAALGKLTNLTFLSMGSNRMVGLPSEFGRLTKLQSLLIGDNPLEVLPESVAECRELHSIFARNTKLKVLPEGIVRLTNLQDIDLSGNELTVLPTALGNLTRLRSLRLGKTRLLALPESIGRLTHLTSLQVGEMDNTSTTENSGLHQLPDSIVYCQEIRDLQLMNQSSLDGDDTFAKASKLSKLMNLTLFHCNLERIPEIDWKVFPVSQLSLMANRLTELPVALLESPKLQQVQLYDNLLPQSLNANFSNKDALRLAMSEAGLLALDKITKPNRGVATSYVQLAFQKAGQRNWTDAFANFEKAIDYASDTMRLVLYAQRADMHAFRQEYAEAIADYDQSLRLANQLTTGIPDQSIQKLQFEQPAVLALRGRANAKAKLGQLDAASADIALAIQRINTFKGDPQLKSGLLTEQGRYLTLRNKVKEANASYRKAIEEYEKMPYANPGSKLTVVELQLIVGQPDQARSALQRMDKRELTGGFAILEKYLEGSIQILKGEKPDAEVLNDLTTYLASHNERIMGWSFELYENWLSRSDLPTEKQTVLRQMTQLTKERLPKMD